MKNQSYRNNRFKKLSLQETKKLDVTCPYCGGKAHLKPATSVHGNNGACGNLYVCGNYPKCDSYVSAHKSTRLPQGTLANKELRQHRIQAHNYFDQLIFKGLMSRNEAYSWLQCKFNLEKEKAHIAMFDNNQCKQVIIECKKLMKYHKIAN